MVDSRGASQASWKRLAIGGYAALILTASSDEAFAYLDPGTGSIILQALIAGAIGMAAVARMYWTRLKDLIRRTFGSEHRNSTGK